MASNKPDYKQVDSTKLSAISGGNNDLIDVMRATKTIVDWNRLSLKFGIDRAEFQRINRNVLVQGGDLQMEIITRWFQLGNASWSALVDYLCDDLIEQYDVAQEIAKAHPLVSNSSNSSARNTEKALDVTDIIKSDIWKKSPLEYDAYRVLKDMSSEWNSLGESLEVPKNFRNGMIYNARPDTEKLENILEHWMQSYCSPVTWEHLFDVLRNELKWKNEATKLVEYLQQDDIKRKYEDKQVWKKI